MQKKGLFQGCSPFEIFRRAINGAREQLRGSGEPLLPLLPPPLFQFRAVVAARGIKPVSRVGRLRETRSVGGGGGTAERESLCLHTIVAQCMTNEQLMR
jgi:hypothetical protein